MSTAVYIVVASLLMPIRFLSALSSVGQSRTALLSGSMHSQGASRTSTRPTTKTTSDQRRASEH
jgi:hypothetical protein